jgi:zinc transporter 9
MAASGSKLAVVFAVVGNSVITVAKFAAFLVTGSGAMLSEAVHSFADVLNQVLLWIGIDRSLRRPDAAFPYGYGAERYVWALMSAVGVFFLGCGVTVYHGVQSLMHPHELSGLRWAVGVLIGSFVIELYVLHIAVREVRRSAGGRPLLRYLRDGADPGVTAVVMEDAAACLGVLIALLAITLTKITGSYYWDAIGSILIGLLLGFVAIFLISRNHRILVGSAIPDDTREKVRAILRAHPLVERIVALRSRVLDSETYRVQAELEFDGAELAKRLEPGLRSAYEKIEDYETFRRFAAGYTDQVLDELGDSIDRIEAQVRKGVPEAKHLDLEAD